MRAGPNPPLGLRPLPCSENGRPAKFHSPCLPLPREGETRACLHRGCLICSGVPPEGSSAHFCVRAGAQSSSARVSDLCSLYAAWPAFAQLSNMSGLPEASGTACRRRELFRQLHGVGRVLRNHNCPSAASASAVRLPYPRLGTDRYVSPCRRSGSERASLNAQLNPRSVRPGPAAIANAPRAPAAVCWPI